MSFDTDVCLVLEGTYPYVTGGVATWTHELITAHPEIKFHILCILPKDFNPEPVYTIPSNVTGVTNIFLQDMKLGAKNFGDGSEEFFSQLKGHLMGIINDGSAESFEKLIEMMHFSRKDLGANILMDSEDAWRMIVEIYHTWSPQGSFLDYFWSLRTLLSSFFSVMLAPLPKAKVYHALCTGYAGLVAARASAEYAIPSMITEHGIYTNERRIEITAAEWLRENADETYSIDKIRRELRDLWMDIFSGYSRICYKYCQKVITLYQGNQAAQLADGADITRMEIIPNGIHIERFDRIGRQKREAPVIALIGRVVPIKDVKTFIRAVSFVKDSIPGIKAYIIGPIDEDKKYHEECTDMVAYLGLENNVEFTGKVKIDDYYSFLDLVVLTSISEAQPLTILEAGAAGIPVVATNVGSCKELVMGRADENPWFGPGGIVTSLANPRATANAILELLMNKELYNSSSNSIKQRVIRYYNRTDQVNSYNQIYDELMKKV